MPTGHEAFLEPAGGSRLRPCARTHLKKGLVPHSSVWWNGQQIPSAPRPREKNIDCDACSIQHHHTTRLKFLTSAHSWTPHDPRITTPPIFHFFNADINFGKSVTHSCQHKLLEHFTCRFYLPFNRRIS